MAQLSDRLELLQLYTNVCSWGKDAAEEFCDRRSYKQKLKIKLKSCVNEFFSHVWHEGVEV